MAFIPDNSNFNERRKSEALIRIKNLNDETVLLTRDEIKEVLIDYLLELDIVEETTGVYKRKIIDVDRSLTNLVNNKTKIMEEGILNLVNARLDDLTEKVLEKITSKVVEQRVEELLDAKIAKIRENL